MNIETTNLGRRNRQLVNPLLTSFGQGSRRSPGFICFSLLALVLSTRASAIVQPTLDQHTFANPLFVAMTSTATGGAPTPVAGTLGVSQTITGQAPTPVAGILGVSQTITGQAPTPVAGMLGVSQTITGQAPTPVAGDVGLVAGTTVGVSQTVTGQAPTPIAGVIGVVAGTTVGVSQTVTGQAPTPVAGNVGITGPITVGPAVSTSPLTPSRANVNAAGKAVDITATVFGDAIPGGDPVPRPDTIGYLFIYDGTNWFRARGDTTNGLDVDVTRMQGTVGVSQTTTGQAPTPVAGTIGVVAGTTVGVSQTVTGQAPTPIAGNVSPLFDANGDGIGETVWSGTVMGDGKMAPNVIARRGMSRYTVTKGLAWAANLSTTTIDIIPAAGSNLLSLKSLTISASAACSCSVFDSGGTTIYPPLYFAANGGCNILDLEPGKFVTGGSGRALRVQCNTSSAVSVAIEAYNPVTY
jgi:hypothetical protein